MKSGHFSLHIETLLTAVGIFMALSELWKQYVLTFCVNGGTYDWWYFPFQLCSIPMYLLILLPFFRRSHIQRVFYTFLMDFSLLGGIFVFLDTTGMHYPLPALTIHSYLWHIALIVIGLVCGLSGIADYTWRGFRMSALLFGILCLLAEILNLSIGRIADINMFYISPYYEMSQAVISDMTRRFGNPVRIVFYLLAILAGALLLHWIWQKRFLFSHGKRRF
ncbi:YwaF family protein [Sellimonas caecigallum]|uniref:YwaF family protein n=1 Tax=Sellimonas caecigallum TaxID=2592333 RepID=A0ABS7L591_9FIRM|nr:YwaF family protein [Sellimonas caecigallum]MBY0758226.1 YwaF family protein [Sellimonas caecigallum]